MGYKFEERFHAYEKSLASLSEAPFRDRTDSFVLSGTGAKFSITFELAWKLMKDILIEYYGVSDFVAGSPRETLRTAFRLKLINDDQWMEMLKLRNFLAHDYDQDIIKDAFDRIVRNYLPLFETFRGKVRELIRAEKSDYNAKKG